MHNDLYAGLFDVSTLYDGLKYMEEATEAYVELRCSTDDLRCMDSTSIDRYLRRRKKFTEDRQKHRDTFNDWWDEREQEADEISSPTYGCDSRGTPREFLGDHKSKEEAVEYWNEERLFRGPVFVCSSPPAVYGLLGKRVFYSYNVDRLSEPVRIAGVVRRQIVNVLLRNREWSSTDLLVLSHRKIGRIDLLSISDETLLGADKDLKNPYAILEGDRFYYLALSVALRGLL